MSERPGTGDLIAGVAGLILVLSMFIFAWFGLEGFDGDAFDTLDDWANIVLVFAAFAGIALALFGNYIPRADAVSLSTATLALGGLAAVVILFHIVAPPGVDAGPVSVDLDPQFGVWVGLISSILVAIGGYMSLKEEGAIGGPGTPDSGPGVHQQQPPPQAPGQYGGPPQAPGQAPPSPQAPAQHQSPPPPPPPPPGV